MVAMTINEPGWYSIEGCAIYTGFSEATICKAIETLQLPAYQAPISVGDEIAEAVRVSREDLDAWIKGEVIPIRPLVRSYIAADSG